MTRLKSNPEVSVDARDLNQEISSVELDTSWNQTNIIMGPKVRLTEYNDMFQSLILEV